MHISQIIKGAGIVGVMAVVAIILSTQATFTPTRADTAGKVKITSISPSSGNLTDSIEVRGQGFGANDNYVLFSDAQLGIIGPVSSDAGTISIKPCANISDAAACKTLTQRLVGQTLMLSVYRPSIGKSGQLPYEVVDK